MIWPGHDIARTLSAARGGKTIAWDLRDSAASGLVDIYGNELTLVTNGSVKATNSGRYCLGMTQYLSIAKANAAAILPKDNDVIFEIVIHLIASDVSSYSTIMRKGLATGKVGALFHLYRWNSRFYIKVHTDVEEFQAYTDPGYVNGLVYHIVGVLYRAGTAGIGIWVNGETDANYGNPSPALGPYPLEPLEPTEDFGIGCLSGTNFALILKWYAQYHCGLNGLDGVDIDLLAKKLYSSWLRKEQMMVQ